MTREERRKTEAALLALELRSRRRLRLVLRGTALHHARYVDSAADAGRAMHAAAFDLRLAVEREVLRSRAEAEVAGAARARAEAEVLRALESMPRSAYRGAAPGLIKAESRAQRVAANTADAFVQKVAARAEELAVRGRAVILDAAEAIKHRVDTIAATESAEAFNAARARTFLTAGLDPDVLLEWSAVLDRMTCALCASLHGELAPIGASFRGYHPGAVHPRCRCIAFPSFRRTRQAA